MGGDTPQRYKVAVATIDASKARIHINSSKSYSVEDMEGETNLSCSSFQRFSCRIDSHRASRIKQWTEDSAGVHVNANILRLGSISDISNDTGKQLLEVINSTSTFSYYDFVLNHPDSIEYAKISIGTHSEKWFKQLYFIDAADIKIFNNACQHISRNIFSRFEKNINVPKKSVLTSYFYQVFEFQTTTFCNICDK